MSSIDKRIVVEFYFNTNRTGLKGSQNKRPRLRASPIILDKLNITYGCEKDHNEEALIKQWTSGSTTE